MMLTKPSGIKRAAHAAARPLLASTLPAARSFPGWVPAAARSLAAFVPAAATPRAARALAAWVLAASFAALAGCGFRLEGTESLPPAMARTYIEAPDRNSEFFLSLRDALRVRGSEIVTEREAADAVLSILTDDTGQRVLSVTARNVPREYEVFYAVSFALDAAERRVIEPESLFATRVYAWNENEVLGKSAEERILRQALAEDLARRVMSRIEASGSGAPSPSNASESSQAPESAPTPAPSTSQSPTSSPAR
jgi:LPS-assembly lipoprotein